MNNDTPKTKAAGLDTMGGLGSEATALTTRKDTDNSTEAQRSRLLTRLRQSPVSTIEARHELDIMMPAARVHELRHTHGYPIITQWVYQDTSAGRPHRVARYVLLSKGAA